MATQAKRDYYEVLGINKGSSEADIKKAFRKLARKYHPDVNPGDKTAEQRFKELNEAYEVLSDKDKRQQYDQFGHAAFEQGFGGAGPGSQGPMASRASAVRELSFIAVISRIYSVTSSASGQAGPGGPSAVRTSPIRSRSISKMHSSAGR